MAKPKFKQIVDDRINTRKKNRIEILHATGLTVSRLKSSPFSTLDKRDMLSAELLSDEFLLIDLGKSKLPAGERTFIRDIIEAAIIGTLKSYQPA